MVCVVFAHLSEVFIFPKKQLIFVMIYFFHMPAMFFCSGLCAKSKLDIKGILRKYVLPYLVFQILYIIFFRTVLHQYKDISLIKSSIWITWYMLALAVFNLLIHLFKTESRVKQAIFVSLSVVLALAAGYCNSIGDDWTLSRIIVLFPFFLTGFYLKNRLMVPKKKPVRQAVWGCILAALTVLAMMIFITLSAGRINNHWFYHEIPYGVRNYNIGVRIGILAIAAAATVALCLISPNRKLFGITHLGQNTVTVYLLHGFVVKLIKKYLHYVDFLPPAILAVLATLIIVTVFSTPIFTKPYNFIFVNGKIKPRKRKS